MKIKGRAGFVATVVAALTLFIISCNQESLSSLVNQDLSSAKETDISELIELGIVAPLCSYAEIEARNGREKCEDPVIEGVCSQKKITLNDSVASLLQDEMVKSIVSEPSNKESLSAALKSQFKESVSQCINAGAIAITEKIEERKNDPELQARLKAGRSQFWRLTFRDVGRLASHGAVNIYSGNPLRASLMRIVFAGICYGGLQASMAFSEPVPEKDYSTPACEWNEAKQARKDMACKKTYASACSAIGGFVDLSKWPGFETENMAAKAVMDISSVGLSALCYSGGTATNILCGVIGQSLEQIKMAITTGDNDWAECTGITFWAGCHGEKFGSEGWTNNSGVVTARTIKSDEVTEQPIVVNDCCSCNRTYFKQRGIGPFDYAFSDTDLGSVNFIGVIQSGDYDSGNCAYREGRIYKNAIGDDYDYVKYSQCGKVTVSGGRCSFGPNDNRSIQTMSGNRKSYWINAPKRDARAPSFIK